MGSMCRRYPEYVRRGGGDWCGEWVGVYEAIRPSAPVVEHRMPMVPAPTFSFDGEVDSVPVRRPGRPRKV